MRAPTRTLALALLALVVGACSDPTAGGARRGAMAAPGADPLVDSGQESDDTRPAFVVATTVDAVDALPGDGVCETASGACSLRAAVQESNALPGLDDITLPAGRYEITLTYDGGSGDEAGSLDVTDPLVIAGAGVNETIIACGAGTTACQEWNGGIFFFTAPATVVSGVTLVGPGRGVIFAGASGVVVASGGEVLLRDVVIREFASGGDGGGVSNRGALWLDRSTIAANVARGGGGGLSNQGTATITNSTLRDNDGWFTSGAIGNGGTLTLVNTTLSGNSVAPPLQLSGASALYNTGLATLKSVTVTANSTYSGTGGIVNREPGVVELANTILAGNVAPEGPPDCDGTLTSLGYNLIGSLAGCTVIGTLKGTLTEVDPLLGPLAENGGPTATHALLPGSPAIGAGRRSRAGHGSTACPETDQRGFPRVGRCDIGAYEVQ